MGIEIAIAVVEGDRKRIVGQRTVIEHADRIFEGKYHMVLFEVLQVMFKGGWCDELASVVVYAYFLTRGHTVMQYAL
jgi:hypothetical protein